jgi:hypothetical protein
MLEDPGVETCASGTMEDPQVHDSLKTRRHPGTLDEPTLRCFETLLVRE